MLDIGQIAVLMREAPDRFATVRATICEWADPGRERLATERALGATGSQDPPARDPWETTTRAWLEPPDRARQEGDALGVSIQCGRLFWIAVPGHRVDTNLGEQNGREGVVALTLRRWTEPGRLLDALEVESVGESRVAGRTAVELVGVARESGSPALTAFGFGAHRYRISVDAERGILLGASAFIDGQPFRREHAVEVAFDEAFGEGLFRIPPDPGTDRAAPGS